ncbi:MAG: hypothetical protein AAF318_18890 [Pseudomonadota bacterium]
MSGALTFGAAGAFLVALGVALWVMAGPAIFSAFTAFGLLICG